MNNEALDIEFKECVERVNAYTDPFPPDILLKLYAYYKIATKNNKQPTNKEAIITAFKTNALFQARNLNLSEKEAKQNYIELANSFFLYGK